MIFRVQLKRRAQRLAQLFVLALCFFAAGCSHGPETDALKIRLQSKLDEHFAKVFSVDSFTRKGSYPFTQGEPKRDHLLVYWDADIRFATDYNLGAWDGLNAGSLLSVMGAQPKGVAGVAPDGNKKDDILRVHGSLAFLKAGTKWENATLKPVAKEDAADKRKGPDPEKPAVYRSELDELAQVGSALHKKGDRATLDRFESDLKRMVIQSRLRLAQSRGVFTFATGPEDGEYFALGRALAKVISKAQKSKWPAASAFSTRGSVENCALIRRGEVDFAFVQNDIASMAYRGVDLFEGQPAHKNLVALATLYPEAVQLVTLAGASLKTLSDLHQKRVDIGLSGSGARINAVQVLAAADVAMDQLALVQGKSPKQAAADLAAGRIDAFFVTSVFPAPILTDLATEKPIRILSLGGEVIDAVTKAQTSFIRIKVPAKAYRGMDGPSQTVAVTAMLVARDDVSDASVQRVLKTLFAEVPQLARESVAGYAIARDRAQKGRPIPLHAAAARFFGKK